MGGVYKIEPSRVEPNRASHVLQANATANKYRKEKRNWPVAICLSNGVLEVVAVRPLYPIPIPVPHIDTPTFEIELMLLIQEDILLLLSHSMGHGARIHTQTHVSHRTADAIVTAV